MTEFRIQNSETTAGSQTMAPRLICLHSVFCILYSVIFAVVLTNHAASTGSGARRPSARSMNPPPSTRAPS